MKLIIFLLLLVTSLSADATNYFRWGWEDTRPSWGVNGRSTHAGCYFNPSPDPCGGGAPAGASTTRDCTVAHSGSCSMKMVMVGVDGGNQGLGYDHVAVKPPYPFNVVRTNPPIYYRWWMRINTGFSWGTGSAKVKSSRVNFGPAGRGYTGYVRKYGVLIGECETACKTNTGADNTDANLFVAFDFTTMDDSQWHEYIVMVKSNTSATCTPAVNCDAELRLWVDGVAIGSNLNWRLSNTAGQVQYEQWGGWMITPYWQLNGSVSDGGTIYIDDVSTDTAFNPWVAPATLSVLDTSRFMATNMTNWKSLHPYL